MDRAESPLGQEVLVDGRAGEHSVVVGGTVRRSFAATLLLERDEEATVEHPFRVVYTLEDGSYVDG